jgi:prevent-host-death family protein
MPSWSVQDAKNRFSAVIAAAHQEPQTVTKHGKPAVVVIDAVEYDRLKQLDRFSARSFTEHLLAMPTDDSGFDRLDGTLRDPGF